MVNKIKYIMRMEKVHIEYTADEPELIAFKGALYGGNIHIILNSFLCWYFILE
jgi:hypothetical protein